MDTFPPLTIFKQRKILLGVTGSIAAYKAADLASTLTQAGAHVEVLLTEAAEQFVSTLTFQSVTGRRAWSEVDLWGTEAHVVHIGLAESADILVIAPATANTLAKLATGQADTLLPLTALAARCPLVLAPAMDSGMYEHAATQANVETLRARGAIIVGPAEGRMASGLIGLGRMVEPDEVFGHIRRVLGSRGPLAGRVVVVTAGGTHEPLDPVRVLANRSSGKQGYALAQAAIDLGAVVKLITGPSSLTAPVGAERIDVLTAADMRDVVLEHTASADVLLMAAAVADFRPVNRLGEKIKRRQGIPEVKLENTPDILAEVRGLREKSGRPGIVVGFAAESEDLVENARVKMEDKGLALIAANDITASDAGFGVDNNRITLLDKQGEVEALPLLRKEQVAEVILQRVVGLLPTTSAQEIQDRSTDGT